VLAPSRVELDEADFCSEKISLLSHHTDAKTRKKKIVIVYFITTLRDLQFNISQKVKKTILKRISALIKGGVGRVYQYSFSIYMLRYSCMYLSDNLPLFLRSCLKISAMI
jgi:hypothetical protein